MTTTKDVHGRTAQLRAISVLSRRPEHGFAAKGGEARVGDGLLCTYDEDGARVEMDMTETMGGGDEAASPGFYGRAGLCGCIAIGLKMTALREDVPLRDVRVQIEQDWDARGVLGMDGGSVAATATRLTVGLDSDAPADVIEALVAAALGSDPWFLSFRDAQPVSVTVNLAERAL